MSTSFSIKDTPDACIIWVSCPNQPEAANIAKVLIKEHLAACVQVIGGSGTVTSFYAWEGELHEESEVLLFIKTRFTLWPHVQKRVLSLHSYTTPEIVAIPINAVFPAYLQWIEDCIPFQE